MNRIAAVPKTINTLLEAIFAIMHGYHSIRMVRNVACQPHSPVPRISYTLTSPDLEETSIHALYLTHTSLGHNHVHHLLAIFRMLLI